MNANTRFDNALRYREGADEGQVHLTPEYVLAPVRAAFGGSIGCDPCTTPENPTGAERFYTFADDGLSLPWGDRAFVNPPYGKAREPWVNACIGEGELLGHRVILLMPAATDTRVFQRAAKSADAVVFVKGRLKFGIKRPNGRQRAASHPSALFIWGVDAAPFAHLGIVWLSGQQDTPLRSPTMDEWLSVKHAGDDT